MTILLALFPILVIFLLLFILKQSSVRAGFGAYGIAILIASITPRFHLETAQLFHSSIKGALISSIVAYVLLFGIFLFHLMNEEGLIKVIASFIAHSTPDPVRQVLLLVVAFSPLVESVSGFGIAIIVVAPILIELGFSRYKATLLSLVGLSAVPWGALATGTVIGSNLGGIPLQTLGSGSAILTAPTFLYFALVAVYLAGGREGLKKRGGETIIVSGSLAASVWLFNAYISVELAGVLGALVAMGVELLFIRFSMKRAKTASPSLSRMTSSAASDRVHRIGSAMLPYLFLTGLLFLSRLIPPVERFLTSHMVLDLAEYSFQLPILYSPGFSILITCIFTIFVFGIKKKVICKSIRLTIKQWFPVTFSTFAFVAMAEIMSQAGMTAMLARAAAAAFGSALMVISPIIGGIGGFLTGSNTGSNAMFINLQVQAAHHSGFSAELFGYAQNTSASHMTMASPSRVLLGVSVSGIHTAENKILRKIFLIATVSLLLVMIAMIALEFSLLH